MKVFKRLKQLSSLALLLCVATQVQAADVDLATAQKMAKSFMTKQVANGRLRAAAASNLKLAKAEASVFNPKAVDYYIFNADKSYVVVAGDDLAPEILMYGEEGTIDINDIPPAMQWVLNKYKYQIDGIKAGTLKPNNYSPKATTAVAPLVNATWDQSEPYNNHTPTSGSTHAVTGCPATSLSMCFYVFKWPKTYPAVGRVTAGITAEALPERAADWNNIIDHYGTWYDDNGNEQNSSYTSAQADAVAWLMRYAGQACNMDYGIDGSGAYDPEILEACHTFGYVDAQLLTLTDGYAGYSQNYTDAQWNEWMLAELHAGRPIEYLASDPSAGGHAFNVFGCDTSGKYYVNWGWSGDSNGYCTLHNFTTATGSTGQSGSFVFNYGEAMIIGIAPPAGALGPQIITNPASLEFEGYAGETYTKTFNVRGYNLEENITIAKSGSDVYTVSPATITPEQAENGVDVTVTYKPTAAGNTSATLTLSSGEAEAQTVTLSGVGKPRVPTLVATPTTINFVLNNLGATRTQTIYLTGVFLTGNVTASLNDPNGVFSVTPATLTPGSFNGETPLPITVSFSTAIEGNYTGSVTFSSAGAESVTVQFAAKAYDGGTAVDPYLDIAKYETIDEAGFSGITNLYKYTEYEDQECAWLTMSNYGAMMGDTNQNWYTSSSLNDYDNSWSASDIFLGGNAYFGSASSYSVYGSGNQTFYVTNCSQVKALVKGSSYSSSNATLSIYVCTVNNDGSVTASTTATDTQQGSNGVITSATLDETKIYKVQLSGGGSYPDLLEIGFCTPLSQLPVPVATDATEVGATEFTANWNACDGADSYTLRVTPHFATPLLGETFEACTTSGSQNISSKLDEYTDVAGWTGAVVYQAVGGLRLGTGANVGSLVTPALDLSTTLGKVYVKLHAKTYTNNTGKSDTDCNLTVTCGTASETIVIADANEQEFVVALDCSKAANQTITFATTAGGKRVIITGVEVYDGEPATGEVAEPKTFTGITGTSYEVTGLEPETTYIYDVMAHYGAETTKWSNKIEVTTLAAEEGITLAELLSTGVDGEQYTISNDLAVVDVADYVNNAFLTDGEGNWIMLTAEDEIFNSLLNMNVIKGGTLKATLSGIELNPVLTATAAPEAGSEVIPFEVVAYNLADTFDPKVNQVIDVTGFWRANEGTMRAFSSGGQSLTLNTSWAASSNTLVDGKRYTVRCAINIKEAWKVSAGLMPKDYDYDFQNYLGYALRLPDTPTAITTIGAEGNEIVNVYNVQGMLLKQNVKAADALKELPRGIYIIGNRKVIVK